MVEREKRVPIAAKAPGVAIAAALAEHDRHMPLPTRGKLLDMIEEYEGLEAREASLLAQLALVRGEKSAIARKWLVRRGTTESVLVRGQTWTVQSNPHGTFVFRRYAAPEPLIELDGEGGPE